MAGPTCSVLYFKQVASYKLVNELIYLVSGAKGAESFSVHSTWKIGGSYQGGPRPFLQFVERRIPEETAEIERAIGLQLRGEIGLAAMRNGPEDHRILAELALWLADRLGGYIDLAGDVPLPSGLPGRTIFIPYATASGAEAQFIVMDASALRAWLSCPQFQMVK